MSKPGVFALSKEAALFVFGNVPTFFNHIKVVFPVMMICALVKQAAILEQSEWTSIVMALVTLFLYGCFALAWHRTSLLGPSNSHEANPMNMRGKDWKFIGLFVCISAAFMVIVQIINHVTEQYLPAYGEAITKAGRIGGVILIIYAMTVFLRASFLFPAQSVGVSLNWTDARRASRGLIWPLIGTNIIFGLIFIVAFSVYTFVAGFVATMAVGHATLGRIETVGVGFILSAPVVLAAFFLIALCVTALSRAYQWGIQNNNA